MLSALLVDSTKTIPTVADGAIEGRQGEVDRLLLVQRLKSAPDRGFDVCRFRSRKTEVRPISLSRRQTASVNVRISQLFR